MADVSERSIAQMDYRRFIDAQREAGKGIAAGELNRREGIFGILNTLPNVLSDAYKAPEAVTPQPIQTVSPSPMGIPTPTTNTSSVPLSIPRGFNVNDRTGLMMQPEIDFNNPDAISDFDRMLNYSYTG
jgi:hypothetical protein